MEKQEGLPSVEQWLREAKSHENAQKVGMYLLHNGTVRRSAKAKVRLGKEDAPEVRGMEFSYDEEKAAQAVRETYEMEGIYYVRIWLNQGLLQVGEDLMYVLVGGDIRPHVVQALEALVEKLKTKCVTERELL